MNIKTIEKIHSLDGAESEITVLQDLGNNRYYVDDIYRRVEQ